MAYGSIYSKQDVRNALLDANKLYKNTFESIDKAAAKSVYDIDKYAQTAMDALNSQYNQTLSQQYATSQQAQQSIYGSDLGSNYKNYLADQNKIALQEAYNSYRQNYASRVSELNNSVQELRTSNAEQVADAKQQVENELNKDVQFAQQYDNAYYDYLTYMYENNPTMFEDERYAPYLTTDEDGNVLPLSKSQLVQPGGIMYDVDGNLTEQGKNLIRLIENGKQGEYSFGSYLASDNKYGELLDWATSVSDVTGETNRDKVLRNIYGIEPDDIVKNVTETNWNDLSTELRDGGTLGKTLTNKEPIVFNDSNIVTYDNPTLHKRSWYISPDEMSGKKYYVDQDYMNVDPDLFLAKYGKDNEVVDIVNDIKKGVIKNGTVFKRQGSALTQWYVYQNGKITHLTKNPPSGTSWREHYGWE